MEISEKGKYKVLKTFKTRGVRSITEIPKNSIINITQIDEDNEKVIGPELLDWIYYDLPVEKLDQTGGK